MNRFAAAPLLGEQPASLRRRLLVMVSLATGVIYVLAALLTYRQARHEVQEMMDGELVKVGRLVLIQARDESPRLAEFAAALATVRGMKPRHNKLALEFVLTRGDGLVLARSDLAPTGPVGRALGFSNVEQGGQLWRTVVLETGDRGHRALIAQSIRQRDKEALEIATKTVLPLAFLLPLLIALIYFSVRRGLRPLDELAGDVAARSPGNLSPLVPATTLRETGPLVVALNRLLDRLAKALDNERRFTADAAHELRTPLAALKIHAQVALATGDPQQCKTAVTKVIAGADRATRLVEQLLRLARLDPLEKLGDPRPVDLADLARNAVEDAERIARERGIALEQVTADSVPTVPGDRDLLEAALRNLVHNALTYAPRGSRVTVRAGADFGQPLLEVRDDGPGVPPEELSRLVERFYRGRDVSAEGSGLGLAIVHRIAELHGARLEIENLEGGGFAASLRWCLVGDAGWACESRTPGPVSAAIKKGSALER